MGAEPNAASTWFPEQRPPDRQGRRYVFRVTVPEGRSVDRQRPARLPGDARRQVDVHLGGADPMATYLATVDIGNWVFKTGTTPGGDAGDRRGRSGAAATSQRPRRGRLLLRHERAGDRLSGDADVRARTRSTSTGAIADNATYKGHGARVLARDPDAAGLLGRALVDHDRPRAVAPVVRRQGVRGRRGTTSGSTRASRRSRSTCGSTTSARARAHAVVPTSTTRGRRPRRSGSRGRPTRSATRCSPAPCTAAAP